MFRFAIRNLLSRPLRTALSVLGLAVAISGMVGLFSIAGGIDRVVTQTFDQIPGLLVQQQGAPIPLFSTLPANWQEELESIPGVGVVDPEVFCRVNQLDNQMVINPPRFAVGMEIQSRLDLKRSIYRESLVEGRFFELSDQATNHCLVSKEISDSSEKGVGETITLNGVEFEIIGVYETGSLMLDVNILMDIATCRSLGRIDEQTVGCFYVEPDGTIDNEDLKENIQNHFQGRDLSDWKPSSGNAFNALLKSVGSNFQNRQESKTEHTESTTSPIEVRTADDWGKRIAEFSGDLNLFLSMMTAIGVSIATLSIVNTMMMSVTERTTEFGILRANGWSQKNIILLMTLESGLIGLSGGVIGVFIGWLATLLVNVSWPGRLQLHAGLVLLLFGMLLSVVLGLIGGLYPAWRASRLSPMESIRRG